MKVTALFIVDNEPSKARRLRAYASAAVFSRLKKLQKNLNILGVTVLSVFQSVCLCFSPFLSPYSSWWWGAVLPRVMSHGLVGSACFINLDPGWQDQGFCYCNEWDLWLLRRCQGSDPGHRGKALNHQPKRHRPAHCSPSSAFILGTYQTIVYPVIRYQKESVFTAEKA